MQVEDILLPKSSIRPSDEWNVGCWCWCWCWCCCCCCCCCRCRCRCCCCCCCSVWCWTSKIYLDIMEKNNHFLHNKSNALAILKISSLIQFAWCICYPNSGVACWVCLEKGNGFVAVGHEQDDLWVSIGEATGDSDMSDFRKKWEFNLQYFQI